MEFIPLFMKRYKDRYILAGEKMLQQEAYDLPLNVLEVSHALPCALLSITTIFCSVACIV